jgi:tyrosinase
MRFVTIAAIAATTLGSVDATFMETDILAAAGLAKLGLHVALNGYPNPKQCTLENVSVRREWYATSCFVEEPRLGTYTIIGLS